MLTFRILIFTLTLVFFSVTSFAEAFDTFFDFLPSSRLVPSTGIINIKFEYDLKNITEDSFIVRPITHDGIISIWDERSNLWIQGTDLWDKMPNLQPEIRIKLSAIGNESTHISFSIQNIKNGVTYQTPERKIWSRSIFEDFIQRLNQKLLSY